MEMNGEISDCNSDEDWQSNQSKNVVKSVLTATVGNGATPLLKKKGGNNTNQSPCKLCSEKDPDQ